MTVPLNERGAGDPLGWCAPCLALASRRWRMAVTQVEGSSMCAGHAQSAISALSGTATSSLAVAFRASVA